jgi:hypothetical protein
MSYRCIRQEVFVHLAYLDDSVQAGSLAIFGAVVMPHGNFGWAERSHSIAIEQIIEPGDIENFQEFRAHELFKGEGAFKGIDETKRFEAIRELLFPVKRLGFSFIYGP